MIRANAVREGLGAARRRARDRRHAGRAVHRPAPDPRSHDAAGVRPAARSAASRCAGRTARSRRWITRRRPMPPRCSAACRSRSSPRPRSRSAQLGAELRASSASSCCGLSSEQRGIVHVIGPELGATQPGKTIVCGDSHTSTHGAFGALAFGIGTTEVGARARDAVPAAAQAEDARDRRRRQAARRRHREGPDPRDHRQDRRRRRHAATSSSTAAARFDALSMDERMTVCNMSIEAGARAGMIAPDETTFAYLQGPPLRAAGRRVGSRGGALAQLPTDAGARSTARSTSTRRRSSR